MTKYIVLVVALLVGGCESEAPEPAMDVDAGTVGSSDCGAAVLEADAMAAPALPKRAEYAVTFSRVSDGELGSCGFDLDQYIGHLSVDGAVGHWSADGGAGVSVTVVRSPGAFATSSAVPPAVGGVRYPVGPCVASLATSGSWSCEMSRQWVDDDDTVRCFNRYVVTGTLLP